jgi:adenosylcobyric acid synthase
MSNAGKSLLCAGLCRVFRQDGYRVAPFKSQNMALNSCITREGLEMGRAQVVQAEACGIEPSVRMNPILLKPVTNVGSQVIVNGEVRGNMSATEYFAMKKSLVPEIMRAYESLSAEYDIVVIEGAGSPAEINLKDGDIVNMGMAKLAKAPVLLVGDIDRGGVFAQLVGTFALLDQQEKDMVKATVINKFRGDVELLKPGLFILESMTQKPVAGVLPMLDVDIDDEDSLAERLVRHRQGTVLDIAVIRLPRISNFTDFAALEATPGVGVRYVRQSSDLGMPDMVIIPGTKSTISDLLWLRQSGLEAAIKLRASRDTIILGICGGYQMLGQSISDAEGTEGGGEIGGMALLPVNTEFVGEKRRTLTTAYALTIGGALSPLSGKTLEGYEIHMGRTSLGPDAQPLLRLESGETDGCQNGNIYGCYLHGFFDTAECREAVLSALCERKGVSLQKPSFDLKAYKEAQYDLLANGVRAHLDMELIYRILEEGI